jgi:ketosteroid isomerase-like protein
MSATTSAVHDADVAARWVEGFAEGWRSPAGPEAFVEHVHPMLADDVRLIQPQLPTVVGRRAFAEQFVGPLFGLVGGIRGEVERWAAAGDTLYIELTLRGRLGRRPVAWRTCDRVTLRDGVAVERESYFDPLPLLAAVARSPRTWPRFLALRLRAAGLSNPRRRRTT